MTWGCYVQITLERVEGHSRDDSNRMLALYRLALGPAIAERSQSE
jgi:hypothetical protein